MKKEVNKYQELQTLKWYRRSVEFEVPDKNGFIHCGSLENIDKERRLKEIDARMKELKREID